MIRHWLPLLALAVGGACTEAAPEPASDTTPVYLALGDSVAFGYDPTLAGRMGNGYPEALAADRGIDVVNASCPGEASGGFVSPDGVDNGCRENRVKYGLHVPYDGTQLQFTLQFLREHPGTQLVTIDIGANDASIVNRECDGAASCIIGKFIGLLTAYGTNLDEILGEIRKVYDGPIVGLAIYNPTPASSIAAYGLERLNSVFAQHLAAWDAVMADGMGAFAAAGGMDPCAAGLLIKLPDGTCDIHPTAAGHAILAGAIERAEQ